MVLWRTLADFGAQLADWQTGGLWLADFGGLSDFWRTLADSGGLLADFWRTGGLLADSGCITSPLAVLLQLSFIATPREGRNRQSVSFLATPPE
eukprot:gene14520-biopygen8294